MRTSACKNQAYKLLSDSEDITLLYLFFSLTSAESKSRRINEDRRHAPEGVPDHELDIRGNPAKVFRDFFFINTNSNYSYIKFKR